VERIERLYLTEVSFEYPEDFDPERLLSSVFGIIFDKPVRVKIRFSKEAATLDPGADLGPQPAPHGR
jgi:hypothetical protein